jgi:hypothetical protein
MDFHWAGDVIFRDTRLSRKRYVIGSPQSPVTTDIREWLRFQQDQVLLETLREIPDLPTNRAWGAFDRRALLVWDFVARRVQYNFDKDRQGYNDFWLFPDETLSLGCGDCEDSAILLGALLVASGISPYCVRVVLGRLYDAHGTLLGGHAWPVYQDEGGVWRLLEATLDAVPGFLPSAAALTRPGWGGPSAGRGPRGHWYWPELCFNDAHLWWIRPPDRPDAVPPLSLDDHLVRREMAGVVNVEMNAGRRRAIWERMQSLWLMS